MRVTLRITRRIEHEISSGTLAARSNAVLENREADRRMHSRSVSSSISNQLRTSVLVVVVLLVWGISSRAASIRCRVPSIFQCRPSSTAPIFQLVVFAIVRQLNCEEELAVDGRRAATSCRGHFVASGDISQKTHAAARTHAIQRRAVCCTSRRAVRPRAPTLQAQVQTSTSPGTIPDQRTHIKPGGLPL